MEIIIMFLKNVQGTTSQKFLRRTLMVALLGLSAPLFASNPTSGQIVIVNGVANVVSGGTGSTASAVKVVVNDATGACYTNTSLAYKGSVTVTWAASNTHGAASCTGITSVDVSALSTGKTVQYDSGVNSTPPATATAATTFTAPTTPITNLALIVTGSSSAATTGSATVWGSAAGATPVYNIANGALTSTGIMTSVGSAGLKAERVMTHFGVTPIASNQ
jgi:hypothetical protein